jgi:hypothetical protein
MLDWVRWRAAGATGARNMGIHLEIWRGRVGANKI